MVETLVQELDFQDGPCLVDRLKCFGIALAKLFAEMTFHLWMNGALILSLEVKMEKFMY